MARATPQTKRAFYALIGIVLIVLVSGFFLANMGLLSVAPESTHEIEAFGETWEVTAPFGSSGPECRTSGVSTTDTSAADKIEISAAFPNSGSYSCGALSSKVDVRLTSLDLRTIQKVVVHRKVATSLTTRQDALLTTDLMGLSRTQTGTSLARGYGDVVITNDGSSIRVFGDGDDATGKVIAIGNAPVYFENTIVLETTSGQVYGGSLSYEITGLEITRATTSQEPAQRDAPKGIIALTSKLFSWIVEQFAKLSALSITGPTQPTPGTQATYQVRLDAPYAIQQDYTKGLYMQRWCDVALVSKQGAVVSETGMVSCKDTWERAYTITVPPGSAQDHVIVAVMVETRQDYKDGAWKVTYEHEPIQKASLTISGDVLQAPTQGSAPQGIAGLLTRVWTWITSLWK